jgi:hypothetical protein
LRSAGLRFLYFVNTRIIQEGGSSWGLECRHHSFASDGSNQYIELFSLSGISLLPHGCGTTTRLVRTWMKLVTEYLADAAKFDELARLEQNPELRRKLENQAAASRNLAAKRAKELMLLEELAELLVR